jgi:hypothetical protein
LFLFFPASFHSEVGRHQKTPVDNITAPVILTSFRERPVCPQPVNPDKTQKLPGIFLRIKGLCAAIMANHYSTASHKPATRPPSRAPLREVTPCLLSGAATSKLFSAPPACEPLLLLPATQPGNFFRNLKIIETP